MLFSCLIFYLTFYLNYGKVIIREGKKEVGMKSSTFSKKIDFEGNIWYIPTSGDSNAIYVSVEKDKAGFGGQVLSFVLDNGTVDRVKGPWNSNADALFEYTKVDLRGGK